MYEKILMDQNGTGWNRQEIPPYSPLDPFDLIHKDGTILRVHPNPESKKWRISHKNKTIVHLPYKNQKNNILQRLETAFSKKGQNLISYWKKQFIEFLLARDAEPESTWFWDTKISVPYNIKTHSFAAFEIDPFFKGAKILSRYVGEVPEIFRSPLAPPLEPANLLYVQCPNSTHARLEAKMAWEQKNPY